MGLLLLWLGLIHAPICCHAALINFTMLFCRNKLGISHDGTREVSGGVVNDNEVQNHCVFVFALKEEPDAAFKMKSPGLNPA